jgi:hypothetical protein
VSPRTAGVQPGGRILLFSLRNVTRHVARCPAYEFEDLIRACEHADLLAPGLFAARSRLRRGLQFVKRQRGIPDWDARPRIDRDYDLFVAVCANAGDLRYLKTIDGLHDRCRRTVCIIEELWTSQIPAHRRDLEMLRRFDCVFTSIESSVAGLQEATGRPCHFLPFGVDALLFSPYPAKPRRLIDVYNMGRRHETMHKELLAREERGGFFYLYDTASDFAVVDPREHRRLLANFVKRSRYFITYPPKFNMPEETGGQHELGSRFFEGAAAGAVMLGRAPRCPAFERAFNWPDAVVPAGVSGDDICRVIAELESTPERVAQIRRKGIVESMRRHDWIYRWGEIIDRVGLAPSAGTLERRRTLEASALAVLCDDFAPATQPDEPMRSASAKLLSMP